MPLRSSAASMNHLTAPWRFRLCDNFRHKRPVTVVDPGYGFTFSVVRFSSYTNGIGNTTEKFRSFRKCPAADSRFIFNMQSTKGSAQLSKCSPTQWILKTLPIFLLFYVSRQSGFKSCPSRRILYRHQMEKRPTVPAASIFPLLFPMIVTKSLLLRCNVTSQHKKLLFH